MQIFKIQIKLTNITAAFIQIIPMGLLAEVHGRNLKPQWSAHGAQFRLSGPTTMQLGHRQLAHVMDAFTLRGYY